MSASQTYKLGFIGAGKLAGSVIRGLMRAKFYSPEEIIASEPHEQTGTTLQKETSVSVTTQNAEAAAKAEAKGLKVVMNRCPKIEYGRLSSEISWMGVNSRTLSSKRAPMPTQGMRLSLNRSSLGGGETDASDRAARSRNDPK